MAQDITIAGASFSDVPRIDVPKTGGGTAKFLDVSGDTVTTDGLLYTMTAHKADGNPITGELIDGYTHYSTNTLNAGTVDSHINLKDYVLDLGWVPKFFLLYQLDDNFDLGARARVVNMFYNRMIMTTNGSASTINRMIYAAQWSNNTPKAYSYSSTAGVNPYDENGVKGVHGFSTSTSTTFRLIGQYRYIAFG